jgi:hypothetical protein
MFFVTLFLNELLAWMRKQSGTSSLRSLLYMDEIFGYFPPTANPPSKLPMITLLKQARAFGLGIVLSTQNPVDLDYKGLSNCGSWFIGKLQTERDKARVLEGLQAASNGELDSTALDKVMALTGKRIFLLRSIYETNPILFETRWSMSYLRGPLTLAQISELKGEKTPPVEKPAKKAVKTIIEKGSTSKAVMPPGIVEYYIRTNLPPAAFCYQPKVIGMAKLHFVDTKNKIDVWQDLCLVQTPAVDEIDWSTAEKVPLIKGRLATEPVSGTTYADLPPSMLQKQSYTTFEKALADTLYQQEAMETYSIKDLDLRSNAGETLSDFTARAMLAFREKRDSLVTKLREKYAPKLSALSDKMRRAESAAAAQKQQAQVQKAETWISFGSTVLEAILGRGVSKGTITQTGTSMRRAGRMVKENDDVIRAEEKVNSYKQEYDELQAQLQEEINRLVKAPSKEDLKIETVMVKPRKSDIRIDKVALVWVPQPLR